MSNTTVLVIARDEMIGALLSTMVDVVGARAVFALPDEHVLTTMRRLQPHVVLLEAETETRDDALFQATYHRAAELGAVLRLFSPSRDRDDVRTMARRRGVPAFGMPIAFGDFERLLSDAMTESTGRRSPPSSERPTESRETTS